MNNVLNDKDEIDLIEVIHSLWEGKMIIICIMSFFLFIGLGYSALIKPTWISKMIIGPPDLALLSDYPEAVKMSRSNYAEYDVSNLSSKVFILFLSNVDSYIAKEKYKSIVSIMKSTDLGYYTLSFSASTAEQAQSELQELYLAINKKTRDHLYSLAILSIENHKKVLNEHISALEMSAKRKQQEKLILLEGALQVAKKTRFQENNIKELPSTIPNEALFMLGESVLEALLASDKSLPLMLNEQYYNYQAWYSRLINFQLNEAHFQSVNILSEPSLPFESASPRTPLIIALSLILGLIVGCCCILFYQKIIIANPPPTNSEQ